MSRLCYPTDIPKGARLLDHDGLVVVEVATMQTADGMVVAVCDASMRTVLLDPLERVRIDEDTAERRARLSTALAVLADEMDAEEDGTL